MPNNDKSKMERGLDDINQAFKEKDVESRAQSLGLPYVNLLKIPLNSDLTRILTQEQAERAQAAIFFKSGHRLRLAVRDPGTPAIQELLKAFKEQGYEVALSLASEESIQAAQRIYFKNKHQEKKVIENVVEEETVGSFEKEIAHLEELQQQIEASDYDQALNKVQVGAFRAHTTDVHFQPEATRVLVRFRIDGVLRPVFYLSPKIYDGILKQIKQLAHLKLNVTHIPQDGQYVFTVNQRQINVRVAILPGSHGENCVMRLLDSHQTFVPLKDLGFEGESLRHLEEAVQLPHGMILVTGPTGSGKTTTLYSMLKAIDCQAKKVITLEDPVEYNLDGIAQSQVNPEIGYTFSLGLKAALRQNPDIIMVGEIRDFETAETAAQASITGHLVISTLHTNSAVESIPRLVNMGVKNFILAPAMDLIVAQRLVRRICSACAEGRPITPAEREHIEFTLQKIAEKGISVPPLPATLKHAKGCQACANTGYLHQLAIAEVLRFNQELRDLILHGKPLPEVYDYINKHLKMLSLHEDGVLKVLAGITTLEEVVRVAI